MIYWAVSVALLVAATVVIIGGWYACEAGMHPRKKEDRYKPSQFELHLEKVRFKSRDGLTLAGWFIPGNTGATVILAHGIESNRTDMLPHADYLHGAGFSVLLFDLRYRGRGESEGDECTLGAKEPWDIEGAVDYLKKRSDIDPERIGVQGISLGGASAIVAAAERTEIKGVVAESTFKNLSSAIADGFRHVTGLPSFPFAPVAEFFCELRMSIDVEDVAPVKVVGRISPRPVFIIRDGEDTLLPPHHAEALSKAAREPKDFWSIPGAEHANGWQAAPEEYERRVLDFWRQTFGIIQPQSTNGAK